jgi:hypothetical protein
MAGKALEPKEETIVDTAIHLFRTAFPNPERQGCPSVGAIRANARRGVKPKDVGVLEHLTCCSPCFVQFEQALAEARDTKRHK